MIAYEELLSAETVEQAALTTTDALTLRVAQAWLQAYHTAISLGFGEQVARKQAALAWELERTAPTLVWPDVP